jgi:hypothetical protein
VLKERFQRLNKKRGTFDFFPEAGGEIEGVGIISDGELASGTSGSSKETDFALGVGSDAVTKAGQGHVAEDLHLLKGHGMYSNFCLNYLFIMFFNFNAVFLVGPHLFVCKFLH